jgi:hypothetical protein
LEKPRNILVSTRRIDEDRMVASSIWSSQGCKDYSWIVQGMWPGTV